MRITLFVLTIYVFSFCYAVNLDIFKWPSFQSHSGSGQSPLERLSRLKTVKKIGKSFSDLKSRVRDFKSSLFSSRKGRRPPTVRPSRYGQSSYNGNNANNGYFKIVRQNPATNDHSFGLNEYAVFKQTPILSYSVAPSTAKEIPNPNGRSESSYRNRNILNSTSFSSYSSIDTNEKTKKHSLRLAPVPTKTTQLISNHVFSHTGYSPLKPSVYVDSHTGNNLAKSPVYEVNAPISAAMTIGNLLEDEMTTKEQWLPLEINNAAPTSSEVLKPVTRGGKDLGLSLKNVKTPKQLRVKETSSSRSDYLEEGKRMMEGGKALSHLVDIAFNTVPINFENNNSHKDLNKNKSNKINNNNVSKAQYSQQTNTSLKNPDFQTRFSKSFSPKTPQEILANVNQLKSVKEQDRGDARTTLDHDVIELIPGQKSNLTFGALLDELGLTILMTLIRRANLDAMLTTEGGFTIFGPSDSAFRLLPRRTFSSFENDTEKLREVILFHVVPGKVFLQDVRHEMVLASAAPGAKMLRLNIYDFGADLQPVVTVNGARLKRPDMMASNVIIHVIDRVLFPMAEKSILEHLASCDTLTGADVAVGGAELVPLLRGGGPFTLFVPSTDAFAGIENATVERFVANVSLLQDVLLFHLVPGTYYSEGLRDGTWLPTYLRGTEVQVRVTSDGVTKRLSGVGGRTSNVIRPDIAATNGVIHILDTVLQPGMETPGCEHIDL